MLLVPRILSLVSVTIVRASFPNTASLSKTSLETTFIVASIFPVILSVAMRFPFSIAPRVDVLRCKFLSSLAMFHGIFKLALISVSIDPHMYSNTIGFPKFPLSYIAVPFCSFPYSRAVLEPIQPLALIELSIEPLVHSFPFWPSVDVGTLIDALIREQLISLAVFEIDFPLSLINPLVMVENDSEAMSFAIDDFPKINSLFILLNPRILRFIQGVYVNEPRFDLIICDFIFYALVVELSKQTFKVLLPQTLFVVLLSLLFAVTYRLRHFFAQIRLNRRQYFIIIIVRLVALLRRVGREEGKKKGNADLKQRVFFGSPIGRPTREY